MEKVVSGKRKKSSGINGQVLDGSNIMELVGNHQVFSDFVDHKFHDLDRDGDGKLSVKELQPAIADIGAALGLPTQGTNPESDHIYSEVLNEFTHGKDEKVSKTEFKEVLSDILLGMAAGLKRDPIVILRIDGEDLFEFVNGPGYEPEMASIFFEIESPNASLCNYIIEAMEKLTVDQGIPPTSDSWVFNNIVEPALQSQAGPDWDGPVSQEIFLAEFKKVALRVAEHLKEQPVIVAHSENTFDGNGVKRLLSNKFELEKTLNSALENLPKDRNGKMSKEYLRIALDVVSPSAGLPPFGAIAEMDNVIGEVFKMIGADDGKVVKDDEFKKILTEILGSIMLQLEGNPISVSSNSVVHEPLSSSSTLLQPSSNETA
ncbi:EF-Hand 1 [Senna tora]|uniref:EF-Hand 1 n=1 Tax=Senna tora TaxID=362788 RepID=A0A835CFR7_9FABA|nr:EF-Hand 1 [Senna tora]